jgi:hypothetical protein
LLHHWRVATKPLLSAAAPDEAADSAARVALATAANGGALSSTPVDGLQTLHDLAEYAFSKYASWPCTGTRPLLELRPSPKGGPPTKVFGPAVAWQTYAQVEQRAQLFGWGLRACGLAPQPDPDRGLAGVHRLDPDASAGFDAVAGRSCVCLYENTCADWLCCCLGAFGQSLVATTVYATLGVGSVVEAVNEGGLKVVFCNRVTVSVRVLRRLANRGAPGLVHLARFTFSQLRGKWTRAVILSCDCRDRSSLGKLGSLQMWVWARPLCPFSLTLWSVWHQRFFYF